MKAISELINLGLRSSSLRMKIVKFESQDLEEKVRFTDMIRLLPEEEEIFIGLFKQNILPRPFLMKDNDTYYIFNGNNRIVVAINNRWNIECYLIENDQDLKLAQDRNDRLLPETVPLEYGAVLKQLKKDAGKWGDQEATQWKI